MSDYIIKRSKEMKDRWARESNLGSKFPPCSIRLEQYPMSNTNAAIRSSSSQRSRQDNQLFKVPFDPPMRNHVQTSTLLRSNSQFSQSTHTTQLSQDMNNSIISHSNMKYLLENTRKTFLKCLDAHVLDFQNNTIQNEEQALLMYTALNRIVCDGMASRGTEKNNGAHLGKMFVELSKVFDGLLKPSNGYDKSTATGSSHHTGTDLGSEFDPTEFEHSTGIEISFNCSNFDEPKQKPEKNVVNNPPSSISTETKHSYFQKHFQSKFGNRDLEHSKRFDGLLKPSNGYDKSTATGSSHHTGTDLGSESDLTEFELAAFHSTQIGSNFDEPKQKPEKNVVNNPPSSISTETKHSFFQKHFQSKFGNRDRGAGSTMHANMLKNYTSIPTEQWLGQSSASDNARSFSPDLSQSRLARSKSDKNASKINAARIKETLSRKLDSTMSLTNEVITPITDWYIRDYAGDKIELISCNSKSLSNKHVSHGVVKAKPRPYMVRTNKGLFRLIGPMKNVRDLPPKIRQLFKSDFPRKWKKTLNDSGFFK